MTKTIKRGSLTYVLEDAGPGYYSVTIRSASQATRKIQFPTAFIDELAKEKAREVLVNLIK